MPQKNRLKKYAELIARTGANIQKGQRVIITAATDQPAFVALLTEACYKAGAAKVSVDWHSPAVTKLSFKYEKEKVLSRLDPWQIAKWEQQVEDLPVKIYLESEDPDALSGVDQKKYAAVNRARFAVIKPIRNKMENKYQWCIAAVPGEAWAKKVFPSLRASAAVEALWNAILDTSRVTENPIAAWEEHNRELQSKVDTLNALPIRELVYASKNGTDFRVGLNPRAVLAAGGEVTEGRGVYFNPNIPTEEVFTSPMKGKAEGVVYSSRPLSYGGQLIDRFWLKFENGRAVDCGAEVGEKQLKELLGMDEGAPYLGEVALVPYSSPIRESGLLFYNTLFDENAACHLALGRGFTNLLRGYETMTEEQAHAAGVNDSLVHVDFMIGTEDLSVTAILDDGSRRPVFENGNWAF